MKICKLIFWIVILNYLVSCNSGKNDEILLLIAGDGAEVQALEWVVSEFHKENVQYRVTSSTIPYATHREKVKSMISGKQAPEFLYTTDPGIFAGFLSPWDVNPNDYSDALRGYFYPNEKEVIAIPMDLTVNGLYLNKDIFDKAGLSYPKVGDAVWTWSEFIEIAQKLKPFSKYPGVLDRTPNRWSAFAYQHGGSFYSQDKKFATITNDGFVKGVQILIDLHEQKILEPSVWAGNGDANSLFRSGEIGFHFSGSWNIKSYDEAIKFNWVAAPMPVGTQRSSVIGGRLLVSFKDAKNKEGVEIFKKFITRNDIYAGYIQRVGGLPGKKDIIINFTTRPDVYASFQDESLNVSPLTSEWGFTPIATVHPKFMDAVGALLVGGNKNIIEVLLPVQIFSQNELDVYYQNLK